MPVDDDKRINGVKHVRPLHLPRLSVTHIDGIQEDDLTDTDALNAVCHIEINVGPGGPNDIEINMNVHEGHAPKVTLKYVNFICNIL
jgi:hypothetical protein